MLGVMGVRMRWARSPCAATRAHLCRPMSDTSATGPMLCRCGHLRPGQLWGVWRDPKCKKNTVRFTTTGDAQGRRARASLSSKLSNARNMRPNKSYEPTPADCPLCVCPPFTVLATQRAIRKIVSILRMHTHWHREAAGNRGPASHVTSRTVQATGCRWPRRTFGRKQWRTAEILLTSPPRPT